MWDFHINPSHPPTHPPSIGLIQALRCSISLKFEEEISHTIRIIIYGCGDEVKC